MTPILRDNLGDDETKHLVSLINSNDIVVLLRPELGTSFDEMVQTLESDNDLHWALFTNRSDKSQNGKNKLSSIIGKLGNYKEKTKPYGYFTFNIVDLK